MTDLDRKLREIQRNEPPDLWRSIETRLLVEPTPASRRRWPALIVAILVAIGGLALAWEGFRDRAEPLPGSAPVITTPAPRQCPWVIGPGESSTATVDQFLQFTGGRGPTWLPEGFGLAQIWSDHADWSDQRCREVTFRVFEEVQPPPHSHEGTQPPAQGNAESVGDWVVDVDVPGHCSNPVLGQGRCLGYVAQTSDGLIFRLQMMGVDRPEGDRIALSISLDDDNA